MRPTYTIPRTTARAGTDVYRFDSIHSFMSTFKSVVNGRFIKHGVSSSSFWNSGETPQKSMQLAIDGDLSLVPQARSRITKISSQIEVDYPSWTAAPYGAYPVVPEAILGHPTPMRRLTHQLSDVSGIKLYFTTSPSGSLSSAQIYEVGLEMLALTMGLERVRPIELYWWEECGPSYGNSNGTPANNFLIAIKISTQPLDLARAAYMLTSAGFVRNLLFSFEQCLNYRWQSFANWASEGYTSAEHMEYARQAFRLTKNDMILPVLSAHHPLIKQPQEWIQSVVARYTQTQEAQA